jgi:hypothetical protein
VAHRYHDSGVAIVLSDQAQAYPRDHRIPPMSLPGDHPGPLWLQNVGLYIVVRWR